MRKLHIPPESSWLSILRDFISLSLYSIYIAVSDYITVMLLSTIALFPASIPTLISALTSTLIHLQ